MLSGSGLCDKLIARPEESYRLWCVVVCDLETSRICAPYIYDISSLRVKAPKFLDTRHIQVVRLSPLRTGRLYPPGISWYSFLEAESTPGHMELSDAPEKIPSDQVSIRGPSD